MLELRKDLFADERDDNLKEIGKPTQRQDMLGHVTATSTYFNDHKLQGMLHLKVLRSPHSHARIRRIDLSEAERHPGVRRIIRGADVPRNLNTLLSLINFGKDDEPTLAVDKVRYKGEPIVAVVADSQREAFEALAKIRVDYEPLPTVFDVEEAMKPGAPIINETYPKNTFTYHDIYDHQKLRFGDVERGFAAADHILEQRYQMSPIEQAHTETNGSIAAPDTNGRYVVYTSTQALFFSLDTCAKILDVPSNKLHFIGGTVGGGFGGKVDTVTEPLSILGAMLTGRPVRYVIEREEEMIYCAPRGAERIFIKDGVSRDGRILARKFRCLFDSGAYTRLSSYAVVKCAAHLPGPYTIPNVYADVYCVFTNRVPATAMRGFGVTAVDFAIECQMDKLAHLVGMDPMEFRLINAYRDGDMKAHRREAKNTALIECVQVAAEKAKWRIRDDFKRMSSRKDGGGPRAAVPATPREPILVNRPASSAPRTTAPRRLLRNRCGLRPRPLRLRRPRRRMALRGFRQSSAPGGDDGQASRTRDGVDELSDRHESRRRPKPGARSFQSKRQVHGVVVLDRPRPGHEVGHAPDLRRNPRRAGRGRLCRHGRFRHRAALHGELCLARHASRRQRGHGGGARGARSDDGGGGRGARGQCRRP
jgi:Molybdopterin-binding domain of aldehyde dehydrogenase/Aldehyde oxidase and xanthine dehydrogenase, a/b hammerhead domain